MRSGLSHRIVAFIGNLFPLYEPATAEGRVAARSLVDGTLIFPVDEAEENENGFVQVHWQADPSRACEVLGTSMATIAVARYIELHAVATNGSALAEYEHLAQHFTHKTGSSLVLETPDGRIEAYRLLDRLLHKSGETVVVELLKKAVGL